MTPSVKTVSAKSSYASFATAPGHPPLIKHGSNSSLTISNAPQGPGRPLSGSAADTGSMRAPSFASAKEHKPNKEEVVKLMYDIRAQRDSRAPSRPNTPVRDRDRSSSELPDQTGLPFIVLPQRQAPVAPTTTRPASTPRTASAAGSQRAPLRDEPISTRRRLFTFVMNACNPTSGPADSSSGDRSLASVPQTLPANPPTQSRSKMPSGFSWKGRRRR